MVLLFPKKPKPKQGSYVVSAWQAAAVFTLDMKLILELVEAVWTCHEFATHPPCAIARAIYVILPMQILSFHTSLSLEYHNLQLFFLQGAVGTEKGGDKPDEETDLLMPGVRAIYLQLQLGKAKGVSTGLFKGTNGTTLSKHKWLRERKEELAPF